MRSLRLLPLLAAACVLGVPSAAAAAADQVPHEVVVRFAPNADAADRADAVEGVDGRVEQRLAIPGARVLDVGGSESVGDAIRTLEHRDDVLYAEPNLIARPLATPNDPLYGQQWALPAVGAPTAWDTTMGSPKVLVGIADTGLDPNHPDLHANVRTDLSRNFVPDGENLSPVYHATHVAGIVGAVGNNDRGIAGVGWNTGLVDLHVIRVDGAPLSDVAEGLAYAGRIGLRIVNASFGIGGRSQLIQDAVAQSPETLFVAAAGNLPDNRDKLPEYPCSIRLPNVLCVAATGQNGKREWWTSFGPKTVALAAPGDEIVSTVSKIDKVDQDFFKMDAADFDAHWTHGGTGDDWGRRDVKVGSRTGPTLTSNDGSLAGGVDSWAQYRPALDLSDKSGCMVWSTLKLKPGRTDVHLALEWSTDETTWHEAGEIAPLDDQDTVLVTVNSIPAGGNPHVWLRYRWRTPAEVTEPGPGAWITEFELECAEPGTEDYEPLTGTSMAAPMVSGAAALLLARNPGLTTQQLRDILLSSARPEPTFAGKTISGGVLDLQAALAKVPPPDTGGGGTGGGGNGTSTPSDSGANPTPGAAAPPTEVPLVSGPLTARVTARSTQAIARTGDVALRVRYDRAVRLKATGTVSFSRGGRVRLPALRRALAADTTTRVVLRLRGTALRRARAAYEAGSKLTAQVTMQATDADGSIRVKRRVVRDRPRS